MSFAAGGQQATLALVRHDVVLGAVRLQPPRPPLTYVLGQHIHHTV